MIELVTSAIGAGLSWWGEIQRKEEEKKLIAKQKEALTKAKIDAKEQYSLEAQLNRSYNTADMNQMNMTAASLRGILNNDTILALTNSKLLGQRASALNGLHNEIIKTNSQLDMQIAGLPSPSPENIGNIVGGGLMGYEIGDTMVKTDWGKGLDDSMKGWFSSKGADIDTVNIGKNELYKPLNKTIGKSQDYGYILDRKLPSNRLWWMDNELSDGTGEVSVSPFINNSSKTNSSSGTHYIKNQNMSLLNNNKKTTKKIAEQNISPSTIPWSGIPIEAINALNGIVPRHDVQNSISFYDVTKDNNNFAKTSTHTIDRENAPIWSGQFYDPTNNYNNFDETPRIINKKKNKHGDFFNFEKHYIDNGGNTKKGLSIEEILNGNINNIDDNFDFWNGWKRW